MVVVDAEGIIQLATDSIAAVVGVDAVEVTGRSVADFVHPERREHVGRFDADTLAKPSGRFCQGPVDAHPGPETDHRSENQ